MSLDYTEFESDDKEFKVRIFKHDCGRCEACAEGLWAYTVSEAEGDRWVLIGVQYEELSMTTVNELLEPGEDREWNQRLSIMFGMRWKAIDRSESSCMRVQMAAMGEVLTSAPMTRELGETPLEELREQRETLDELASVTLELEDTLGQFLAGGMMEMNLNMN